MLRSPGLCIPQSHLGTVGKFLAKRGAWDWFHGIWTYGMKVMEF